MKKWIKSIKRRDKIFILIFSCIPLGGLVGWFIGNQLLNYSYGLALIVALLTANIIVFIPAIYFRDELDTKPLYRW